MSDSGDSPPWRSLTTRPVLCANPSTSLGPFRNIEGDQKYRGTFRAGIASKSAGGCTTCGGLSPQAGQCHPHPRSPSGLWSEREETITPIFHGGTDCGCFAWQPRRWATPRASCSASPRGLSCCAREREAWRGWAASYNASAMSAFGEQPPPAGAGNRPIGTPATTARCAGLRSDMKRSPTCSPFVSKCPSATVMPSVAHALRGAE